MVSPPARVSPARLWGMLSPMTDPQHNSTDRPGQPPYAARQAALAVLADLREGRRTSRESLETLIEGGRLPPGERGLAAELVLGVVRHRLPLARVIGGLAAHGWQRINHRLQHILQLGAYQLIWLDGIPAFAAVAEAVDQAKAEGGVRAGRFVNAVLRQLQREIEQRRVPIGQSDPRRAIPVDADQCCQFSREVLPDPREQPVDYWAAATSHPDWLVARWVAAFGLPTARQICLAGICRPTTALRPNPLRTNATDLAARMLEDGVKTQLHAEEGVVTVDPGVPLARTKAFAEGLFQAQDRTAMAVVRAMDPQPGQVVLDLCAGPGTKTTQLAELMRDTGLILASDKDAQRLVQVSENSGRLGLTCVRTAMPTEIEQAVRNMDRLDWILVDAPCSNTGVLARRPEARYRVGRRGLEELSRLQLDLLSRAHRLAGPQTRIMYSTCSLELEEDEHVVERFLARHDAWKLIDSRRTFPDPGLQPGSWHDGGYWAHLARA